MTEASPDKDQQTEAKLDEVAAEADASPEARLPGRLRLLGALGVLLTIGLAVLAWRWLDLLPPDAVRLAAGRPGSGYHQIALRYRQILSQDGIRVEIVETGGSVENAARLAAGEADVALLQGGVQTQPLYDGEMPETLASLFIEPVFIFARDLDRVSGAPSDWSGLRAAVGGPGSGVRFALDRLAGAIGMEEGRNTRVPVGGQEAAEALLAGGVDVAVFVAPVDAPYLAPLFASPEVSLVSVENRDGLARRLVEMVALDLPAGTIDYAARVPPREIHLLGTVARMIARPDLHPAVINRLVRAAQVLHGGPGLLSPEGQFPVQRPVERPLNRQAGSLLREEQPVLETMLPYWISAQINRVLLVLVPLILVSLPLLRMIPSIYEWIVRYSIHRHDRRLREIDMAIVRSTDPRELDALAKKLEKAEMSLRRMQVPLGFRPTLFLCRSHVDLIRSRLVERRRQIEAGEAPLSGASSQGRTAQAARSRKG